MKKQNTNLNLMLFVAPALIVYSVFKLYPAVTGLYYAMTDWNGINKSYSFIGLANFIALTKDRYFWNSILFTLKYVIVIVFLVNALAILLAVLIESMKSCKGFFRTLFYMPNMISMIIGGYMWNFIITKVLYYLADNWGLKFLDKSWIGDPQYAFVAIVIVAAWGSVGYLMIIYMAALQGVPVSLKEAAYLDGVNPWQLFWKVIFPLIRPAVTICIFWTLNSGFQVFDVIYALTGGGPGRATQSVAMNIFEEAFRGNIRYGYATAKSTLLFLLVMVVTLIQIRIMSRKELEA
jgi:raffinose/stachyose/melibiose transport system permease protein